MGLFIGTKAVSEVWLGSKKVSEVWIGTNKVWPVGPIWLFTDNFNRTSLGSDWQSSGTTMLDGRALAKARNTVGSSDTWSRGDVVSDDFVVEADLYDVTDRVQRASLVVGNPTQYLYAEFSQDGGLIGAYDGRTWNTLTTMGPMNLHAGTTVRFSRVGSSLEFAFVNGAAESVVGRASSTVARGPAFRRVNLSTRGFKAGGFWGAYYYGPSFDSVRCR